jgi:Activator of Hsp90 ATPase homolog 1-like protein
MNALPPIQREIFLPLTPSVAFGRFVDDIAAWWPVATHSVFGQGARVSFEGGLLIEQNRDGQRTTWAEVVALDPPRLVHLNWHAGQPGAEATDVVVTFEDRDGGTLVSLQHRGWERRRDPESARREYDTGWDVVLGGFQEQFAPLR